MDTSTNNDLYFYFGFDNERYNKIQMTCVRKRIAYIHTCMHTYVHNWLLQPIVRIMTELLSPVMLGVLLKSTNF